MEGFLIHVGVARAPVSSCRISPKPGSQHRVGEKETHKENGSYKRDLPRIRGDGTSGVLRVGGSQLCHGYGRGAEGLCVNSLSPQKIVANGKSEEQARTPLGAKIPPGISLPGGSLALFSSLFLCHLVLLVS